MARADARRRRRREDRQASGRLRRRRDRRAAVRHRQGGLPLPPSDVRTARRHHGGTGPAAGRRDQGAGPERAQHRAVWRGALSGRRVRPLPPLRAQLHAARHRKRAPAGKALSSTIVSMGSHVHDPPQVARDDLAGPAQLSTHTVRARLLFVLALVLVVVVAVVLLPGLGELRTRLAHASAGWLLVGVGLKVLSGLGYVAVFRMVFCRRMSWRVSSEVGMSELGANALFPTGGAGGLALGAWALKRGGMPGEEIARRTVAFFLLTSVPNVLGVIILGFGLATGVIGGEGNLLLTALPAAIAAGAIVLALRAGRIARHRGRTLERRGEHELSRRRQLLMKGLTALGEGVQEAVAMLREGC